MNRRIFATIIGIAFCVTYLAGTIAMVGGLQDTTSNLAGSFDQGPVLIYTDQDFTSSRIDGALLPGNDTKFVGFCFASVTLKDFHGRSMEDVFAVSIFDPEDSLGLNMTNESVDSGVWIGNELVRMLAKRSISTSSNITYMLNQGNLTANIRLTALYSRGSILPDDWLLIPRATMDQLRPDLAGDYSFLMILESDIPLEDQPFHSIHAVAQPTTGVVGFFEKGIYQVEQGLWGIVLMSGAMTTVLVYCIISIETEYSAPTIKILRGMGASREYVIRIFMMKALFITFVGGILGTAMGFCAANAITSLSSLLKVMTFITPVADFKSIVLPVFISVISGAIGGFWPAMKASRLFAHGRDAK
jgi:hypothetical protein